MGPMKILLTILCAVIVLFAGGCALILIAPSSFGGLFAVPLGAVIPGGIAALNVLVIAALWGRAKPRKAVFYTLVVLDALVVAGLGIAWAGMGTGDSELNTLAGLTIGAFAAKGLLTYFYIHDARE